MIKTFEKRQQADYLAETGLDQDEVTELLVETEVFVQAAEAWLKQKGN